MWSKTAILTTKIEECVVCQTIGKDFFKYMLKTIVVCICSLVAHIYGLEEKEQMNSIHILIRNLQLTYRYNVLKLHSNGFVHYIHSHLRRHYNFHFLYHFHRSFVVHLKEIQVDPKNMQQRKTL